MGVPSTLETIEAFVEMAGADSRFAGIVKFFDAQKGFGFITRDDGQGDVFLHNIALKQSGCMEPPENGDRVTFAIEPGRNGKGFRAKDVKYG